MNSFISYISGGWYEQEDDFVDEYTYQEDGWHALTYRGKGYQRDGVVEIVREKGVANALRILCENKLVNVDCEFESNSFRYKRIEEMKLNDNVDAEDDINNIANIYDQLIKLGIVIEGCMFVRTDNKLLLQLPARISQYLGAEGPEKTRIKYYRSDIIEKCVPKGMDHKKVMNKIWGEQEIEEMEEIEDMREVYRGDYWDSIEVKNERYVPRR